MNKILLEKWFKDKGLSRREFAKVVGISHSHLAGILVNKKHPSLKLLKRLREVTKIPLDQLIKFAA